VQARAYEARAVEVAATGGEVGCGPLVRFLGPDTDAYVASVERHAAEFEEQSGLRIDVRIVPSDLYFSNNIRHLLEGEEAADVYMSGPVLMWDHLGAGFVRPLDDLVAQADDAWDEGDFLERLLACNRWTGRFGDPLGEGPLLEIPVNCESYNLAYVPRILAEAGVDVPTTWAGYLDAAGRIAAAGSARGFAQRGTDAWHTMYTGYATQLWSCGGRDFEDGSCAIASDTAVRVTSEFLDALHRAGPADWIDQRWYELALDFARGRYGLIVDSDHYVAFFEDPETSPLAGEIAYALPPAGPDGTRRPNLWTWSLVVNAHTPDAATAWRFVEWASSKEFLLRSTFEGNMNPTRRSAWDDPGFREHARGWGGFYDVARRLVEDEAFVLVTPTPAYLRVASRWVDALLDAYAGRADVGDALASAAGDIDAFVRA
jgi:multiple sugar transport system substrate-binding protein